MMHFRLTFQTVTVWQNDRKSLICATVCVFAHQQALLFYDIRTHSHAYLYVPKRKRMCEWTTKYKSNKRKKVRETWKVRIHRWKLKAKLERWTRANDSEGWAVENVLTHATNIYTVHFCEAWNMSNCCDWEGKYTKEEGRARRKPEQITEQPAQPPPHTTKYRDEYSNKKKASVYCTQSKV